MQYVYNLISLESISFHFNSRDKICHGVYKVPFSLCASVVRNVQTNKKLGFATCRGFLNENFNMKLCSEFTTTFFLLENCFKVFKMTVKLR
jgi:hypothetical protein